MSWEFSKTELQNKNTPPERRGHVGLDYGAAELRFFDDNLILVNDHVNGNVTCIDLYTGSVFWKQTLNYCEHVGYKCGVFYIGISELGNSCKYAAFDSLTGNMLWKYALSTSYDVWQGGGPLFTDDAVILCTNIDICGIDIKTGKNIFKTKITDYNRKVQPFLYNGQAVIYGKNKFYCYDVKTGQLVDTVPVKKGMENCSWGDANHDYIDYIIKDSALWYIGGNALRSVDFATKKQEIYTLPCEANKKATTDNQYELYEVDDKFQIHMANYFARTEVFRTKFNPDTKEFEDTSLSENYLLGNHTKKSVTLKYNNSIVNIGDFKVDLPSFGKKDCFWADILEPYDGVKLVLQRGKLSGKDNAKLSLIY